MSALEFLACERRARTGLKGPRAAQWLAERGIALPVGPNTWTESGTLLVARLGATEFFLAEDVATGAVATGAGAANAGAAVRLIASAVDAGIPGIYPVLREDAAFVLRGEGALDVLTQVCNVNFAALDLRARPVVLTMVIGVSVLIVPQPAHGGRRRAQGEPQPANLGREPASGEAQYRIWCDPTFGSYLGESVGRVVIDCGGNHRGMAA